MSKIIINMGQELHVKGRTCRVIGFGMGDFLGDPAPIKVLFTDGLQPNIDDGLLPGSFDEFAVKPEPLPLTEGEVKLRNMILDTRDAFGSYGLYLNREQVEEELGLTIENIKRITEEWPVTVKIEQIPLYRELVGGQPQVVEGIIARRTYSFTASDASQDGQVMAQQWQQRMMRDAHDIKARVARNATAEDADPDGSSPEAFATYHAANPQVYAAFKMFTGQLLKAGHRERLGAKLIIERIRWESLVSGGGEYKVNNNYAPYYARLFMADHPQYDGVFATRKAQADL